MRGIEKILTTWEDILLDVPHALPFVVKYIYFLIENKFLDEGFLYKIPHKLVKEINEGDELREQLEKVLVNLSPFKKRAKIVIRDYFIDLSMNEVAQYLKKENLECFHHEFTRLVLTEALRRNIVPTDDMSNAVLLLNDFKEREILSQDSIDWGILRWLGDIEDLAKDVPKYETFASDVLGQLLTKEVVSSVFVSRCRQLEIGGACVGNIFRKLGREFPEYYRKSVRGYDYKLEVRNMIQEYFDSGDKSEAKRILQEFSLTDDMRTEFVRKLVYFAMERSEMDGERAMSLLTFLKKHEELSATDINCGFHQLQELLPELELDLPKVREQFSTLVQEYPLLVQP